MTMTTELAKVKRDIAARKAMPAFGPLTSIERLRIINATQKSFSMEMVEALVETLEAKDVLIAELTAGLADAVRQISSWQLLAAQNSDERGKDIPVLDATPPVLVNGITNGKKLTITLPDTSSKAFWGGTGKNETFHPETYKRRVKEAIERACAITGIEVKVK